ncbi:MAG: hypothetical protein IPP12_10805 [Nitrospira sp.]|nr:hypothetical protein [Nitrospira sp.]
MKSRMPKKKKSVSMIEIPEGVAAVGVSADGKRHYIHDPFLRGMRWKGISVDSALFKKLPSAERLYRLSKAYLIAAIVLCEQAGEARERLEWAQGSVIYYCLHLATELFLKACIQGVGKEPSKHHEIAELWRAYKVLLPGAEYNFQTSWAVSPKELDQIVGVQVLHGVDRTPDQLFRYSMDKKGGASKNVQIFTPGYFFNYMKDLEVRWAGIWDQIKLNAKLG